MWAPNHRLTEPWRFHVITGKAREDFGNAMAAALKASGETHTSALAAEAAKPLRAPVVIVVSSKPDDNPVLEWENHLATAAAVQNLLLAAHGLGLGAFWRTGSAMYSSRIAEYLRLDDGERVIGAVYLGYPDAPAQHGRRSPADTFTRWIGWNA